MCVLTWMVQKCWPLYFLHKLYNQFASVFGDISNDRATDGMLRPPPVTCLIAASRNSTVYFRWLYGRRPPRASPSVPTFITYLHKVKLTHLVASVFWGPDHMRPRGQGRCRTKLNKISPSISRNANVQLLI